MQNAFSTLKVMNSSLLIVFPFTELEKFCVFFLNPDLIPELNSTVVSDGNNNGNHAYCGESLR